MKIVGRLDEVHTYGTMGSGDVNSLSVMGAVTAVVQLPDSSVVVLDQYSGRAVRFASGGEPLNTIGSGRGRGPGEMLRAVSLALVDDSSVSVLDYELKRLTVFRATGERVGESGVGVRGALRHVMVGGRVWVLAGRTAGRDDAELFRLGANGEVDLSVHVARDEDLEFSGAWSMVVLEDSTIAVARQSPGLWAVVGSDGALTESGTALFPDLAPPTVTKTRYGIREGLPSASTVALAVSGCTILVRYLMTSATGGARSSEALEIAHRLAVYGQGGNVLGAIEFPTAERWGTKTLYLSPVTGHLFLIRMLPYPSVIEYRVEMDPQLVPRCAKR